MNIQDQAMKALDVLESSEVLHEFDDSVTLRVERDEVMINVCTKCGIEGEQD